MVDSNRSTERLRTKATAAHARGDVNKQKTATDSHRRNTDQDGECSVRPVLVSVSSVAQPVLFEPFAFGIQCRRTTLEGTKLWTTNRCEVGGPKAGIGRLDM